MGNKSRAKNLLLNVGIGYFAQIGIFILTFVGRRVFLNYLSVDYLGINGLYSNILTLLSLPELGLDVAVLSPSATGLYKENTTATSNPSSGNDSRVRILEYRPFIPR